MKHENNGHCEHCMEIVDKYPGFYEPLELWFIRFQEKYPFFHTSCAGRGKFDQELFFQRGATRAHYGASAHSFNAALDLFVLTDLGKAEWLPKTFHAYLAPELLSWIKWYGDAGAAFYELPHIEVRDFKEMIKRNELKLVEGL